MCGTGVISLQRSGTWTLGGLWLLGRSSPLALQLHPLCLGECARSRDPEPLSHLQQFRPRVRVSGSKLRRRGEHGILRKSTLVGVGRGSTGEKALLFSVSVHGRIMVVVFAVST